MLIFNILGLFHNFRLQRYKKILNPLQKAIAIALINPKGL